MFPARIGSGRMLWGGAGLVVSGRTRDRVSTEAIVNCRNLGY